jgi:hypothetical protein
MVSRTNDVYVRSVAADEFNAAGAAIRIALPPDEEVGDSA